MAGSTEQAKADWSDLLEAIEFTSQQFGVWSARGLVSPSALKSILEQYVVWRQRVADQRNQGKPFLGHGALWPLGRETGPARELALWLFVEHEVNRLGKQGVLSLSQMHGLLASVSGRIAALKRQIEPQKLEIYRIVSGLLLLAASQVGDMREQEQESEMVSLGLMLGSILLGIPPALAPLIDRSRGAFLLLNEMGFLGTAVLLLAIGLLFKIRATTITGAALCTLYFLALLFYVPWDRLNTLAIMIAVVGAVLFGVGLLLSVFREKLLALPQQVKNRKGVFRVLDWR